MNKEKLIKNQKRNVIIISVIYLIIIIANVFLSNNKLNYISLAILAILLVSMWITASKGIIASGILGIIVAVLFFISFDIFSIILAILLLIDSINYITKINKV